MFRFRILIVLLFSGFVSFSQGPILKWANSFNAYGNPYITTDNKNNVYILGSFSGTVDFDPGPSTNYLTSSGNETYITKQDSLGNFLWAKQIGKVNGHLLFVDSAENIIIVGGFFNTNDFDPGPGTYTLTSTTTNTVGQGDMFILKLDSAGSFIWANMIGGSYYIYPNGLCADNNLNIYVTGMFIGTIDFDPGVGTSTLNVNYPATKSFLLKLNPSGIFKWVKEFDYLANNSFYNASTGGLFITGRFFSNTDFDPNSGTFFLSPSVSGQAAFASKIDTSGTFIWAKEIVLNNIGEGCKISVDKFGYSFITGSCTSSTSATYTTFISRISPSGSIKWTKTIDNLGNNYPAETITTDKQGNTWITGSFKGNVDFDPGPSSYVLNNSSFGVFVLKLDSSGNFSWCGQIGNTPINFYGRSISSDNMGNIYCTGQFGSIADFDMEPSSSYTLNGGSGSTYIFKIGGCCSVLGIEKNSFSSFLSVYPNPNKGNFNIQIETDFKNGKLILLNSIGEEVHSQYVSQGNNNILPKNISDGIYLYIIYQYDKPISQGKLIISSN